MPLVTQHWIKRTHLRSNPEDFYIFGDNVKRLGSGPRSGQAGEMRGEPNAIGVVTKWEPTMEPEAFFRDTVRCKKLVDADLALVERQLLDGRLVVLPEAGIGGDRARLPNYAPRLDAYIKQWFRERKDR